MKDLRWSINRLKAMNLKEIFWRIEQKILQTKEKKRIYNLNKPVTDIPLPDVLDDLKIKVDRLSINWDNKEWDVFQQLDLFCKYDYNQFRKAWHAGFQTDNEWPRDDYSPTIKISQRLDIGDIRTNWELNRHYQLAALAKSFYCTKEKKYFMEFVELFNDWNKKNLFLHGVEWASAMEIAIRVNSWVYSYAFLKKADCGKAILEKLEHGIFVMTDFILKHHARFSSANNHLIIEMYAVALVGIITDNALWRDYAITVLTEELIKQNHSDGVNKEMSLHYQSFVMEAYGLLWLLMSKNQLTIPKSWKTYLTSMSEFISDSTDDFGKTMEFGDSDDGKILDLNGEIKNHYQYVLNLMSCLLDQQYTDVQWHENLEWIVPQALKTRKRRYIPSLVCSREDGGYTFLRSKDRRVLIGIDHAELGYGSIAAHGHADALSFQMFIDGNPVLVDAGTFNYHVPRDQRSYFRSSHVHNTVAVKDKEQAKMLGPFLWGEQYKVSTAIVDTRETFTTVMAEICYDGIIHKRLFSYNHTDLLMIEDNITCKEAATTILNLSPAIKPIVSEKEIDCKVIRISSNTKMHIKPFEYSDRYNSLCQSSQIRGTIIGGNCFTSVKVL